MTTDPNILSIENPVESEVLLTTEESSTWLLDSGVSYHVVALLRACVENEAGPPGSWTEEQVIKRGKERERDAHAVVVFHVDA